VLEREASLQVATESWQENNAQLVSALNAQSVSTGIIRSVVMVVVVLGSVLGLLLAVALIWAFTHFVKGSDGLPLFNITCPGAWRSTWLQWRACAVCWRPSHRRDGRPPRTRRKPSVYKLF